MEKIKVAEDFNIPAAYASVEELLQNCKPDYVDVCTWPAAHGPVSIAAANAGCHVMCEKPVRHNLDDAIALGCTEVWELAERFQVTEDFIRKTVCWYVHGNVAAELYF